jgi:hypothetical protein
MVTNPGFQANINQPDIVSGRVGQLTERSIE